MPMPFWLGRFNTRYTNRVIGPVLVWLPSYGWIRHVGRRTGRTYRTPMMLFRHDEPGEGTERGVFALTYGERTQWLKNVMAAGSCTFESPLAAPLQLDSPRLVHDPTRRLVPWVMRLPLRVLRVSDFLVMRIVPARASPNPKRSI